MGILEPITHKEEIEKLINDAQQMYDNALNKMEKQKKKTSKSLEKLGQLKLDIWSGEMQDFMSAFSLFNNVQMDCKVNNDYHFAGQYEEPQELMINIQRASMTANEILKTGTLAIGAGALVGIASYGGVMMFAHASTGTAIAALSGAAKTNAALAWFGGGSLKVGGLGKLGGKLVLSGIIIAPILLVAGAITAAKSKEKLAEAKKIYAEAEKAVAQMNVVTTGMQGIEKMANNYSTFLQDLSNLFKPFIIEMNDIAKDYEPNEDGKIDFDNLTELEQRTLHISWLMAQVQYHSLSATILTEDGEVSQEARTVLETSKKDYAQVHKEVNSITAEKAEIKHLLTSAKDSFAASRRNYVEQKIKTKEALTKYSEFKIDSCSNDLKYKTELLLSFNGINIGNLLHYQLFCESVEVILPVVRNVTESANQMKNNMDKIKKSVLLEFSTFDGVTLFEKVIHSENVADSFNDIEKHDLSLWLSDELDKGSSDQVVVAGVSMSQIDRTAEIVENITGKESLDVAKSINSEVINSVSRVVIATKELSKLIDNSISLQQLFAKVQVQIEPFEKSVQEIITKYSNTVQEQIDFSIITESEQKVVEWYWNLVKLQYYILNSSVVVNSQYTNLNSDMVKSEVEKELKLLKQESFKMTGIYAMAADIIWRPYAQKMSIVNFIGMGLFILFAVLQFVDGNLIGLTGVVAALVALPIFLYFKNLPQSRLLVFRTIRLLVATFIVLIGLVV